MLPQVAVVVAAADVVARNQKTDIIKKRRSFLRLFHYNGLLHHYTLRAATNFIAIHEPSAGRGGRYRLHVDHTAIGIQHRFMHHFGQGRMREDGVH